MSRGAITGLLIAVVLAAGVCVGVIVALSNGNDTLILDLDAGQCFDLPDDWDGQSLTTIDTVACAEPHDAEVVATGELNPDADLAYPDDDELFATIDARCRAALADAPQPEVAFGIVPVGSNEQSWESFRGRFACVAIPSGGGTTTGSVTPLP